MAKRSAENPRESGFGRKPRVRLGPLPDVADQIEHTVRGRAVRKASHAARVCGAALRTLAPKGIPLVAPWIRAAFGSARRALPFERGRQPATAPGGVPPRL